MQPLPWQAQLSSYRDATVVDANGDKLPDILLVVIFMKTTYRWGATMPIMECCY
jgi:hypothetical protein